jgi:hypothetical protein
MKRMFGLMVAVLFVVTCVPAVWGYDPDEGGQAGLQAQIGDVVEGEAGGEIGLLTHTFPRNVNISSEDWNDVADSVLLRVRGINADSSGGLNSQGFGVVACDRTAAEDTASISLMRTGTPNEIVTSTNDSEAGESFGNSAFTVPRFLAEGASETLFAVLTAPELLGVIDAGWQIGSGGFRTLSVSLLDTFNTDGSAPVVTIGGSAVGCGVTLFPR